jgi:signal transduction histidine kinase
MPTNRVYCLLVDKRGFLWIGHEFGLTRYDGSTVTNYETNKQHPGKVIYNIVEDNLGRIWCQGFDDVYYLKNEKLTVIRRRNQNENPGGSLLSFKNNIYITTGDGLSVYDTQTLKCKISKVRIIPPVNPAGAFSTNLFVLNDHIFVVDPRQRKTYIYDKSAGLKTIHLIGLDTAKNLQLNFYQSKPGYPVFLLISLFDNKSTQFICHLTYLKNKLFFWGAKKWRKSTLSTIKSVSDGEYWVNGVKQSISNKGENCIGYNFTDVVIDKEGNKWFSSWEKGLFVSYKNNHFDTVKFSRENVTSITKKRRYIYCGTQSGNIYKYDPQKNKTTFVFHFSGNDDTIKFFEKNNSVKFIKYISGNNFIINSNFRVYLFNDSSLVFNGLGFIPEIKDAERLGQLIFITDGMLVTYFYKLTDLKYHDLSSLPKDLQPGTNWSRNTCLSTIAISYEDDTKFLAVATTDKLIEFKPGEVKNITYHHLPIVATAMLYTHHKLYIATKKDGLLVYEKNLTQQLIPRGKLNQNYITLIRKIDNKLWLFGVGTVQVIDIKTGSIVKSDLTNDLDVNDALTMDQDVYIVASGKLYRTNITKNIHKSDFSCFNLFTMVNLNDTLYNDHSQFSHDKNNIQFNLSFPIYRSPEKTYYKYRLIGSGDKQWQYSKPGETSIHFASLMPGNYKFEASALNPNFGESCNSISYQFLILEPWWQIWWFKVLVSFVFSCLVFFIIRAYYISKLYKQKVYFEKALALEKERQRISREIHDDIGQSLSVIKLNLNMGAPSQLQEAKSILNDVIKELRDFTHNLYYGKLLLNDLVESIKKDVERLNATGTINAAIDINWKDGVLTEQNELLVYRIFQEAINNILKHADAKNIGIVINSCKKPFTLVIKDDGAGFLENEIKQGLGLNNMIKRAEMAGGQLKLSSRPGKGTEIRVIINHVAKES